MAVRAALAEIGQEELGSSIVWEDNRAALLHCLNDVTSARTRHIMVRVAALREATRAGIIDPRPIPTDENVADIFTKLLTEPRFVQLRGMLGLTEVVSK